MASQLRPPIPVPPDAKAGRRRGRRPAGGAPVTRNAVCLCGRPFGPEGPAAAETIRPPVPADRARCRAILDSLFRPAWPAEAAGWADALVAEFGSLPAVLAAGNAARARRIGAEPARFLAKVQAALLHGLRLPLEGRPGRLHVETIARLSQV